MLLVIMHNDREYLEEVAAVLRTEGVGEVAVFGQQGLVKHFSGVQRNFFLGVGAPEVEDEYDYALVAAAPGGGKIERLQELIQSDPRLYPAAEEGLMFTLPYASISRLFARARGEVSLAEVLVEERVVLDLSAEDRPGVLVELVELLGERVEDKAGLVAALLER